jgi:hypothetical protein
MPTTDYGTVTEPAALPVTVAYLILTHGNPDQLARLVATLPLNSPVMVHFDLRADARLYERSVELLSKLPKLRFVKRHACRWGAFGIVRGTISLIQALIASEMNFDYATLLSGSDYPIKSNREIAMFLDANRGREFIESFLLTAPNRWSGHGGYYKAPERMLCRHLRFRSRVMRLPGLRKMPAGLKPYGGSQWWTLSREAIAHIVQFIDHTPEFLSFSKQSFIPDESFIQTIVSNSRLADMVTGDDLRLVIWDRPLPPYPATLTIDDLDTLLTSNKFFARKFNARTDATVLQALDDRNAKAEAAHASLL